MESGVIVYAFILAGIITFLGIIAFILINRRDSKLDNRSYDDCFDPGSMVKKYHQKNADKDSHEVMDPKQALKRFEQSNNLKTSINKKQPKATKEVPKTETKATKTETTEIKITAAKTPKSPTNKNKESDVLIEFDEDDALKYAPKKKD